MSKNDLDYKHVVKAKLVIADCKQAKQLGQILIQPFTGMMEICTTEHDNGFPFKPVDIYVEYDSISLKLSYKNSILPKLVKRFNANEIWNEVDVIDMGVVCYHDELFPESINLEPELNILRQTIRMRDYIIGEKILETDTSDDACFKTLRKMEMPEYKVLMDIDENVTKIIYEKLSPVLDRYLKAKDFEGAKKFVGNSYQGIESPGKTLLFRNIIVAENKAKV